MDQKLIHLDSRQLRSLFLKESKKFLKTLDYNTSAINEQLKDQMLSEIRENLKELLHLIELREREEGTANN
jgi:hypothetical protein